MMPLNKGTITEPNCGLAPGYLPVEKSVFEKVQAELLYPCTVDAYASQQTALSGNFCTPAEPAFSVNGTDCNVYWLHCPKDLQSD
jgi:hypothetical protein